MDKKDKMRNNRRCIIYGCSSSSINDADLKFFRFPSPDSAEYHIWLSACKDSYNQIRVLKKPLVCSLHFAPEDVGCRRLHPKAFPRLNLSATKDWVDFEERGRKITFLNQVMEEWFLRNRPLPLRDMAGKVLMDKAMEVRDLLDIPNYVPDKNWLKSFHQQIAAPDSKLFLKAPSCGLSLHVAEIIKDLRKLEDECQSQRQYEGFEDSIEISDDDDDDYNDGDVTDNYADLSSKLEVSVKVDDEDEYYEPSMKMPKLQSILLDLDDDEDDGETSENLEKKKIGSYKDALKYMKPLEDFALQREDFRAIGLLTQLEAIFKQQQ